MSDKNKSILEQMGIDSKDFIWEQLAACKNRKTNLFFDDYEAGGNIANNIDQLCLSCPVIKDCYEKGVRTKSTGVWGGFYLVNGEVSKTKNSHKDQETVQKLAKLILDDDE